MKYCQELKEKVVKEIINKDRSVTLSSISVKHNIPATTLCTWIKQMNINNKTNKNDKLSKVDKLEHLLNAASLRTAEEKSAYCRENGFYFQDLEVWKKEFASKDNSQDLKKEKDVLIKENKELKKEIRIKEKALAETAALLALKKKFHLIMNHDEDD